MSKSVGIRMPDETKRELENIERDYGITKSDVVQILVMEISKGHFTISKDGILPTDEYLRVLSPVVGPDIEYEHLGFGKIMRAYEKNGYPEYVIRSHNEMIASQINEGGKFSRRRFNEDAC